MALCRICCLTTKIITQSIKLTTNKNQRFSLYLLPKRKEKICIILGLEYHTTNIMSKRRKTAEERKSSKIIEFSPKAKSDIVDVWRGITLGELTKVLNRDISFVSELFLNKVSGENTVINDLKQLQDAIKRSGKRICLIGKPSDTVKNIEDKDVFQRPHAHKSDLKPRPPVVTVMGHVDHGKTTLLDALRNTSVVATEFGGITQHIGAFLVMLKSGAKITFLDTPGHAAFSAMRERGANITDIVVLVVAADDGVMEQTVESIRMAKQANVPILVAINKIDAPLADIERTERMLVEIGLQVEKLGGDIQSIPVSALKQKNLEALTEALVLQAELLDIGADPTGLVEAVVVDSKIHPHRGRLCTVVIQRGTLKRGDILVADTAMCKVRTLKGADGKMLENVGPGYPVEIEGWKDLPPAGELVLQVESEKRARSVLKIREDKKLLAKAEDDQVFIDAKTEQHNKEYKEKLMTKRKLGRYRMKKTGPRTKEIEDDSGIPSLNVIIKSDVDGTLEAVLNTLDTYESSCCTMDLIHYGVGAIIESDIELAKTFNGIIYAFNVDCPKNLKQIADASGVIIKHHNVIYKLVDDVKNEINVRLPSKEVEEVIGEASILQQFEINEGKRKVMVAGCRCVKGVLKRAARYRLVRNEDVLFDGSLSSMRHLKSEVDTIKKDLECGLQLFDKTVTFQAGDTLICYEKKLEPQKTDWDPGF